MGTKDRLIIAAALCIGPTGSGVAMAQALGTLNLTCSGQADKTEYTLAEQVRSQGGDVRLYLSGDGGTADIPRFIGGAKEGRLVVKLFSVTDEVITGKIDYRPIGNAKMRIDRMAGTVAITGPKGNFSGQCHTFDPAQAAPKF